MSVKKTSLFLSVVRWAIYIPVGMALMKVLEIGTFILLMYLLQHWLVVIGIDILTGSVIFLAVMGPLYLYYGAAKLTELICPYPKLGMVIFGVLYYVIEIWTLAQALTIDAGTKMIFVDIASFTIRGIIVFIVIQQAWQQNDDLPVSENLEPIDINELERQLSR